MLQKYNNGGMRQSNSKSAEVGKPKLISEIDVLLTKVLGELITSTSRSHLSQQADRRVDY